MRYFYVFCSIALSVLLGFSFLRFLTCPPLEMSFFLFLTCAAGFLLVLFLFWFLKEKRVFLKVVLLCFFVSSCSYVATLHSFMSIDEERTLPEITRVKGEKGLGHTAIVVLAHGEPETYDAGAWIKQMKELDENKTPFIPYPFRSFFFNKLRSKYLQAGKSEHNSECLQIMKEMEQEYRKRGDKSTKFYMSYLENQPTPDAAVIQAINEGADNIILCYIFVTLSSHTQEAVEMIEAVDLEGYNIKIKYTKPLYDSETLQLLYVDKVNEYSKGLNKEKIGVLLVGHGQPLEWDKKFYSQTQQESLFREDIFKQMALLGYSSDNLKLAWMEFRDPRPKHAVKQLLENQVNDIFYFSTIIGKGSLHVKCDVPDMMHKIKLQKGVRLAELSAFDDYSGIVKALIERVLECE